MLAKIVDKTIYIFNPRTRGMMNYVKDNLKGKLRGAEIGVAEGFHAFKYLRGNKNIFVWLIDPYEEYEMDGEKLSYSEAEKRARKRLKVFKDRIEWVKLPSTEASKKFEDEWLDFVYIDANHSYESVKKDISDWYSKIIKGGIIGGHDFSGRFPGVAKAVIEYSEENELKIYGSGSDWWYIK